MIAERDFPLSWPNFLPQIISTLKSTNDFNISYGCLLAFKMLVKHLFLLSLLTPHYYACRLKIMRQNYIKEENH